MGALATELKAARMPAKPKFQKWFDDHLDDEDRAALIEAARSEMSHKVLIATIRKSGGSISEENLKDWRRSHGWAG